MRAAFVLKNDADCQSLAHTIRKFHRNFSKILEICSLLGLFRPLRVGRSEGRKFPDPEKKSKLGLDCVD